MSRSDLPALTIADLQSLLRRKEVSPREVLDALCARIETLEPKIDAYLSIDFQAAAKEADKVDVDLPLGGVPIAIKDIINVKGQPCTCGSKILANYRSPYDAGLSFDIDDVFDRDRHTAERKIDIHLVGFSRRGFEVDREIGVDFRFKCLDSRAERIKHFARRNFLSTKKRLQVGDRQRRQVRPAHSTTLVTTKSWFALWGALLSASWAVNQSRGSSSRNTLKIGIAWAAASTWLTSTSPNFSAYFKTSASCFWKSCVSSSVKLSRASFDT